MRTIRRVRPQIIIKSPKSGAKFFRAYSMGCEISFASSYDFRTYFDLRARLNETMLVDIGPIGEVVVVAAAKTNGPKGVIVDSENIFIIASESANWESIDAAVLPALVTGYNKTHETNLVLDDFDIYDEVLEFDQVLVEEWQERYASG